LAAAGKENWSRGERNGVMLAIVPGPPTLSLRKLAQASGNKRAGWLK
jgi:prolyl-tRNA editing enzyme YbaK/EbsC (Cys-tRNA(Pro) deacylase)